MKPTGLGIGLAAVSIALAAAAGCHGEVPDRANSGPAATQAPGSSVLDAASESAFGDDASSRQANQGLVDGALGDAADAATKVAAASSPDSSVAADVTAADVTFVVPSGLVYLKPSNTKPGPTSDNSSEFEFGYVVALQGNTLAIGAPWESSDASGVGGDQTHDSVPYAGAVYVFTRSGTTWTQQAYLKPSNGGSPMRFGWSVALDGDTLIVGAPYEAGASTGINGNQNDTSLTQAGAVYVFTRSGTTWSQDAYVKPAQTASSQMCGFGVAVSQDTMAFACPGDQTVAQVDGSVAVGSVYILTQSSGVWSQQALLQPANAYGFGGSISLQQDLLAVGIPYQTNPADGSGRTQGGVVDVFSRSGSTWSMEASLSAKRGPWVGSDPPSINDYFGWSIALSNGTLAIGTPAEAQPSDASTGNVEGAVYVFTRTEADAGATWSGQARIGPGAAAIDPSDVSSMFARSVALDTDRLVIGAYGACPCIYSTIGSPPGPSFGTSSPSGQAATFVRSGSAWSLDSVLSLPHAPPSELGFSVAVSGTTIAVGDPADSSGATGVNGDYTDASSPGSGAVYVLP